MRPGLSGERPTLSATLSHSKSWTLGRFEKRDWFLDGPLRKELTNSSRPRQRQGQNKGRHQGVCGEPRDNKASRLTSKCFAMRIIIIEFVRTRATTTAAIMTTTRTTITIARAAARDKNCHNREGQGIDLLSKKPWTLFLLLLMKSQQCFVE